MVRVVSCRFMRISCSEDDHPLFRRYYARSNRERGVKLLRCFPHCCPEHVQRCYCGTSIHVMVTFNSEPPPAGLLVCARFEPSRVVPLWPSSLAEAPAQDDTNERKLRPGEIVSLSESLLPSGNRKAKQTTWIRADREGDTKQNSKNATLYVLNNHRYPKWLYTYDSSVTRTQREMTHHLVVYVCQVTGTQSQYGEVDAIVLARHESPGFSLVSYRRSGNNASDAGCDLPAIEVAASGSDFAAVDVDTRHVVSPASNDMEIDSHYPELMRQHPDIYETKRARTHNTPQMQFQTYHILSKQQQEERRQNALRGDFLESYRHRDGAAVISQDHQYLWQLGPSARICGFRDKGQHLLILWRFVQSLSLGDLGFDAYDMDKSVRPFWLRAAAALHEPKPNSSQEFEDVVRLFLEEAFKDEAGVSGSGSAPKAPLSRVIRVAAHLFLRGLTSCTIQRLLLSACMMQSNATSKPQLQERFVLLLSDLYDALGDVLGEVTAEMVHRLRGNQALSLPALVDDVLSLVYSLPRFSALRVEVSTLLLSQEPVGSLSEALNCAFQTFVALAREAMIVPINMQHTKKYAQQQPLAARPGHNDPEWNQRWLLEPGSLQIAHVASGTAREALSLADFAQLVYEFGCIDINLADDRSSLSLQSAYSLSGGATTTPMTLVLDGRLRVFRALPSGISSMVSAAGGWSLGDYMATFSEDTHALNVDFFMFADVKTSAYSRGGRRTERHVSGSNSHDEMQMRRVNLSIKLEEDVSIGDSGDIFAFVCGTLYSSSYTPASMSVTERMQGLKLSETSTVDRATVWREAKWSSLWKLQTGYIVPRVGFV
ncbi:hypothetical protein PR003_g14502 [Phytophthora rubi]|uniref:Uncharacterized protein n=1 Tax=Phytophthora rubi TaxID=129364 RepID=A0A6A3LJR8_9STRA|nr:hypothetical protein PR002_g14641 [Phytophthora rubi]KAE9019741.1 hypothetical protein PR001_g13800 [Phytophthora rubi]KAE9332473.1 hypothetical protein PR003_g14502 [Phytophthora rubi]